MNLCKPKWHFSIIRILLFIVLVIYFVSGAAFALTRTNESFISTEALKIDVLGHISGGQLGAAITKGDFNGDGIDDFAVSAPFSSVGSREWNGSVSVIFGRQNLSNLTIDLADDISVVNFFGAKSGDQFGTTLSSGDFNDDGIDDLVIGAYNAHVDGLRPGSVYIVYGQVDWSRQSIDFGSNKPDLLLSGQSDTDEFGLALSSADVDNNGIDDLLVGAPNATGGNAPKSGKIYGYLGGGDGLNPIEFISLDGQDSGERFGSQIAVGNLVGDGSKSLVVSAYKAKGSAFEQAGKVYIYKLSEKPEFSTVIEGIEEKQWFGFDLALGDLNGDEIDDLAVTTFPYSTRKNTGSIAIFYGGERFNGVENFTLLNSPEYRNVVIGNPGGEAFLGSQVVIDDFNHDGKLDIAAGAPGIGPALSTEAGNIYLFFNHEDFRSDYSVENADFDVVIHGENMDDWFAYKFSSLDFNNDGYRDLAIGSRYSDDDDSVDDGKIFVLLGRESKYGKERVVFGPEDSVVNRGDLVKIVFDKFNLRSTKKDFLDNCYKHTEFCLFNFTATSLYDDLKLDPQMILYPDVQLGNPYYRDIVDGTMLGIINGFMNEVDSPFHPDYPISRVQALKVVLGAVDMVPPKYKFQLVAMLGSYDDLINQTSYFADIDPRISYMWWYPRYVNFAVDAGIIEKTENFRPDENITLGELNDMISNTLKYLEEHEETKL